MNELLNFLHHYIEIRPVPLNELNTQHFGLRRSGNHAVIDWLLAHYSCDKYHYNNVMLKPNGDCETTREHIDFIVGNSRDLSYKIASFEDIPLGYAKDHLIPAENQILILRDPFNTFASRLQKVRTASDEGNHKLANQVNKNVITMWKQYAKEFITEDGILNPVCINFNEWVVDKSYRMALSEKLGIPFTDSGYGSKRGWKYSGGSSFQGDLQVLDRWRNFENDPEYLTFFDEELVEISRILFGEPPIKCTKLSIPVSELPDTETLVDRAIWRAASLAKSNRDREAEIILKQAQKVAPNNVQVLQMLSILQNNLQNHKDAIKNLNKAIELKPENAENYSNIAMCYSCLGEIKKAISFSEKAVELDRNPIFLNNLGLHYKKANQPDKAIACFEESLEKSYDPYVVVNLGSTWSDKLDVERARSTILEVIEKHPGISGAHVNLSWCYLVNKEYEKGWAEYEYRLRHFPQCLAYLDKFGEAKMWDGEVSLEGKEILIFCEQGLGDAVQFIRYVKFLKARKVIVCCSIALAELFQNVEGVDEICYKDLPDKYPEHDYHLSAVSLPYRLKKPIPWQEVYIKPSKKFTLPDKFNNKLKIGLCWRGNPDHHNDFNRSMDLVHFYDITKNDAYFFSLQKDGKVNPSVMKTMNIEYEYIRECHDLNETAALINDLDLVVTVDTVVLHLAAAMGKETLGLIPFKPDWRWGLNDAKSVWYPDTLRLLRQDKLGDWSNVVEQLNEIIKEKVNK